MDSNTGLSWMSVARGCEIQPSLGFDGALWLWRKVFEQVKDATRGGESLP